MTVTFTDNAEEDLERIGDFIAADNPLRALTFVQELRDAATSISHYPNKFQLVPRYEHSGIRRRPYGAYLIFYAVEMDHVIIVRILHGAQDYEDILFPSA